MVSSESEPDDTYVTSISVNDDTYLTAVSEVPHEVAKLSKSERRQRAATQRHNAAVVDPPDQPDQPTDQPTKGPEPRVYAPQPDIPPPVEPATDALKAKRSKADALKAKIEGRALKAKRKEQSRQRGKEDAKGGHTGKTSTAGGKGIKALTRAMDNRDLVQLDQLLRAAEGSAAAQTLLFKAAAEGYTAGVELLLDHHANVQLQSQGDGCTALHFACKKGHHDVVRLIVQRSTQPLMTLNARVTATGTAQDGFTGLHFAAQRADREIVRMLLKHRADADVQAGAKLRGPTALELARDRHHVAGLGDPELEAVVALLTAAEQTNREPAAAASGTCRSCAACVVPPAMRDAMVDGLIVSSDERAVVHVSIA